MPNKSPRQTRRPRPQADPSALDSALRLLTRRDHTRWELALKLGRKGFDRAAVDAALARCEQLGYLDDARTAMTLAGHLFQSGYGPLRVRQTLGQKGVAEPLIEAALDRCGDEATQVGSARRMLEKQTARLLRQPDPWKRRQMAFRYLAGRGFPPTVINATLKAVDGALFSGADR